VALRGSRLIGSLVVGLVFAFLTWVVIGDHPYRRPPGNGLEYLGWVIFGNLPYRGIGSSEYLGEAVTILLLPGMFAAVMVSGNIHIASTWIVALGNFVFYFGVVYLVLVNREKRKAKRRTALGGET